MKVLVCGGRDYSNYEYVRNVLYAICDEFGLWTVPDEHGNKLPTVEIIHGGARGADSCADQFAVVNWCKFQEFKADWAKHGKAAGPMRNQQMLEEGKPDLVVAFPGGVGTADMVRRAKKANVPVRRYSQIVGSAE